eukprot:6236274-Prymnesium_polylepis.1
MSLSARRRQLSPAAASQLSAAHRSGAVPLRSRWREQRPPRCARRAAAPGAFRRSASGRAPPLQVPSRNAPDGRGHIEGCGQRWRTCRRMRYAVRRLQGRATARQMLQRNAVAMEVQRRERQAFRDR